MKEKLYKENALIELTPKSLTVNERKGFNVMLKLAKEHLKSNPNFNYLKDNFEIDIKTINELTGIKGSPRKTFDYLKGLMNKKIINYYEADGTGSIIGILDSIWMTENVVKFALSRGVHSRLVELKYTTLNLGEIALLRNKFAVTLYEWVTRYKGFKPYGKKYNFKWTIEKLRENLGAIAKTYDVANDLKRNVIEKAVNEINEKTDFTIRYELHKTMRKYTDISFFIDYNQAMNLEEVEEILISEDMQKIIDKILKTDLIIIENKRVDRKILESSIMELNKQHKKSELIIKALKKLVVDNKRIENIKNLKGFIWNIAKSFDKKIEIAEEPKKKKIKVIAEEENKIKEINNDLIEFKKEVIKLTKNILVKGQILASKTYEEINDLIVKHKLNS